MLKAVRSELNAAKTHLSEGRGRAAKDALEGLSDCIKRGALSTCARAPMPVEDRLSIGRAVTSRTGSK